MIRVVALWGVGVLFFQTFLGVDLYAKGGLKAIENELIKIQGEEGMKGASIGFCMIPFSENEIGEGQKVVLELDQDRLLIPASGVKIITTATALGILGSDFRFKTVLKRNGKIDSQGVLHGDLIIQGGGDPTLGAYDMKGVFQRWRQALEKKRIKKIKGLIIGDASIFEDRQIPDSWSWGDIGNYYGAGASGLSFHHNLYQVYFRPGQVGGKAVFIKAQPSIPGVHFYNEMKTGPEGSGDQGVIYVGPYGRDIFFRGTVPAGYEQFSIKGSIPDPPYFCVSHFVDYLKEHGIQVDGMATTTRRLGLEGKSVQSGIEKIHSIDSKKLSELIVPTNRSSVNLYADAFLKQIGYAQSKEGSMKRGWQVTRAYWKKKNVIFKGMVVEDGSGLSRRNRASAFHLTQVLYEMTKSPHFDTYYQSMAVAGHSGTLRFITGGTAAEGRIRGKSGTMSGVRNYLGYATARSGKKYAFTLLINNYACSTWEIKKKVTRIMVKMVDEG